MGRRSQHTPEELRELILGATRRVVEADGICQPSAREIARAIGYAPGTLYNMFQNLDEILLHVEARIFDELDARLATDLAGVEPRDAIRQFAETYVSFACENPRLWALINQHHPEPSLQIPAWYLERSCAPLNRLETVLARSRTTNDATEISRNARLIWTTLHGLVQVGMTGKFSPLSRAAISTMAQSLADQFTMAYTHQPDRMLDGPHANGSAVAR